MLPISETLQMVSVNGLIVWCHKYSLVEVKLKLKHIYVQLIEQLQLFKRLLFMKQTNLSILVVKETIYSIFNLIYSSNDWLCLIK